MDDPKNTSAPPMTRRRAIAQIGAAAASLAAVATGCDGPDAGTAAPVSLISPSDDPVAHTTSRRMPTIYLPHGGGPWPFVDPPMGEPETLARMTTYLEGLAALPAEEPRALLVVSAHWEEQVATVQSNEQPDLFFDYYGFPEATYRLTWPAPGAPALASRVRELLADAGIASAEDRARGYDHGTFVPLKLTYPEAHIPTAQLSLVRGLDPAEHLAMGRALAPLRDEGVFIVGSGMSYHNMRGFGAPSAMRESIAFDDWLEETVQAPQTERERRLSAWLEAPSARACHPREEHLLPLMVVAGAAGSDPGTVAYRDRLFGVRIAAHHFGEQTSKG